jgi:hypothetical protein
MPRNSSGTYSLPAGNPVAPNTLIETSWANPTMADLGAGITDSLDRNGRGSMLAQLKLTDGTVAAPGFAFTSETTTGMYRAAANTLAFAVAGVLAMSMNATTIAFNKTVSFTNAVAFPQGTAGAPGVAFSLDLDTGMWSPGADTLAWATGGVERLRISSTGAITFAGAVSGITNLTTTGNTVLGDAAADTLNVGNGGLIKDAAGNVGIGGAPAFRLHVIAASANAVFMAQSSDASGVQAYLQANSSTDARVGTLSNVPLLIIQNTTERMRFDTAGNVGIGGVPTTKLDVFNGNIRMTDSYSLVWGDSSTYISGSAATDIITVTTAGAERARFAANGTFTLTGGQQITGTTVASSGVGMELLWDGAQSIVQSYSRTAAAYQVMTFDGSQLRFNSGGAEKMRILASAADQKNVVIGGSVADNAFFDRTALQLTGGANGAILTFRTSAGHQAYLYAASDGGVSLTNLLNANLSLGTSGAARLVITGAGVIQDAAGNELGYKGIPQNVQAGAYVLVAADNGKHIAAGAGVTVNNGVHSAGHAITICNTTAGNITITQGAGFTLRLGGTATTGNRTLAQRGVATILFLGASEGFISGAGLT